MIILWLSGWNCWIFFICHSFSLYCEYSCVIWMDDWFSGVIRWMCKSCCTNFQVMLSISTQTKHPQRLCSADPAVRQRIVVPNSYTVNNHVDAYHRSCHRNILGIRWFEVMSSQVIENTMHLHPEEHSKTKRKASLRVVWFFQKWQSYFLNGSTVQEWSSGFLQFCEKISVNWHLFRTIYILMKTTNITALGNSCDEQKYLKWIRHKGISELRKEFRMIIQEFLMIK